MISWPIRRSGPAECRVSENAGVLSNGTKIETTCRETRCSNTAIRSAEERDRDRAHRATPSPARQRQATWPARAAVQEEHHHGLLSSRVAINSRLSDLPSGLPWPSTSIISRKRWMPTGWPWTPHLAIAFVPGCFEGWLTLPPPGAVMPAPRDTRGPLALLVGRIGATARRCRPPFIGIDRRDVRRHVRRGLGRADFPP